MASGIATSIRGILSSLGVISGAAVFVGLIRSGEDFNRKMRSSLAIMGEVSTALRVDMRNAAFEAARATQFSAAQAAESYFFLASAGLSAEQSIASMSQVAAFAQAGMFSLSRATDLATDAQSALGLTVKNPEQNLKNLTHVTDVLVKANTLANASVEQFAMALTNKAAAAAKIVGMEIEEVTAVLAAFADQGVKSARAGNAINIILRDMQSKAIENKSAFDKFGVTVFDTAGKLRNMADIIGDLERALGPMTDEQKKVALAQMGFADRSVIFIQTLLGTSEKIREYERELRKAGGTTKDVADKQLTPFQKGMAKIGAAFTELFSLVTRTIGPTIETLGIAISGLVVSVKAVIQVFTEMLRPLIKLDKQFQDFLGISHSVVGTLLKVGAAFVAMDLAIRAVNLAIKTYIALSTAAVGVGALLGVGAAGAAAAVPAVGKVIGGVGAGAGVAISGKATASVLKTTKAMTQLASVSAAANVGLRTVSQTAIASVAPWATYTATVGASTGAFTAQQIAQQAVARSMTLTTAQVAASSAAWNTYTLSVERAAVASASAAVATKSLGASVALTLIAFTPYLVIIAAIALALSDIAESQEKLKKEKEEGLRLDKKIKRVVAANMKREEQRKENVFRLQQATKGLIFIEGKWQKMGTQNYNVAMAQLKRRREGWDMVKGVRKEIAELKFPDPVRRVRQRLDEHQARGFAKELRELQGLKADLAMRKLRVEIGFIRDNLSEAEIQFRRFIAVNNRIDPAKAEELRGVFEEMQMARGEETIRSLAFEVKALSLRWTDARIAVEKYKESLGEPTGEFQKEVKRNLVALFESLKKAEEALKKVIKQEDRAKEMIKSLRSPFEVLADKLKEIQELTKLKLFTPEQAKMLSERARKETLEGGRERIEGRFGLVDFGKQIQDALLKGDKDRVQKKQLKELEKNNKVGRKEVVTAIENINTGLA